MNYKFGQKSERHLATVRSELSNVCRRALGYGVMDAAVIQGRRCKAEQDRCFELGKSKLRWPNSKHNVVPPCQLSSAVDVVPCINGAVSWDKSHCLVWSGLMLAAAVEEGVNIRWGGNWNMDGEPITDQNFNDLVHFELVR